MGLKDSNPNYLEIKDVKRFNSQVSNPTRTASKAIVVLK